MTTNVYESGTIPQVLLRDRLRIARERAGLEQGQLAAAMAVSRNTVSNIESGKRRVRRIVVNAWALACGVPVSWLLGNDGDDGQQIWLGPHAHKRANKPTANQPVDLRAGLCHFPYRLAG